MRDFEIIPAILTDSPIELRELVARAEGNTKRIHIDIIDGVYVNNKTIDPSALNDIETTVLIDFHLMVNNPVNWLEKCVVAGGSRAIAQIEMMNSAEEYVKKAQELGISPGIAIDLDTSVDSVEQRILMDVDMVLVMSVPAGYGGQEFNALAIEKILRLNELRNSDTSQFIIADDGGITPSLIRKLQTSGVDEAVIGRRIFEGDLAQNLSEYKRAS